MRNGRWLASTAILTAAFPGFGACVGEINLGPSDGGPGHGVDASGFDANHFGDAGLGDSGALTADAGGPPGPTDAGGPQPDASSSDPDAIYRQACIDEINRLRATKSLSPYQRWTSNESCVDQQATHDESVGIPHDAFTHGTPSCGGMAQNECPGWGSPSSITSCLDQMWAEGTQPGCSGCDACDTYTIFQGACPNCTFNGATVCGHYVNMTSKDFTEAACGFSADGTWAAINFD